jgi:hypothetical protein
VLNRALLRAARNRNVGLALTVLQRRLASSLAAIRSSLERRRKKLKDLQKLGKLKQEYGELPDDLDDLTEAERWKFEDDLVERLTMAENMAELEAEIEELDRLVQLARHTEKNVTETKFEELRSVISNHLSGRAERLLVFTEHKDTLDFLVSKLTNLGFHCCTIHGGMSLEKRIDAEREFFEHKPSVMVATEAAGEGINLQFCSLMVNYDIPWNPNRFEQRMGRIHRYKQEREAMIWNIVAQNTREGEVMECLLDKLDDMRSALGSDRVYDVIGEIIPAPRFDALMKDWLSRRRTMTEILADIQLQTDEEQVARIKADMQDKALGSRYIDMSKLNADVQQSRENRLMPEYIERFFLEAWRSFGGTITQVKDRKGVWSINRVPPDLRKLPDSLERKYGKIGNTYPLVTFDKELLVGYSDLEFIGPGHPLFEGVVERVLRDYGRSLRQGTIFYNADATEPTVLWLLKCGVEDGRGQIVGERLFAIHRTGGAYRKSQPYALLDLKPPDGNVTCPPPARQAATDEDRIIEWSLDTVTPDYFGEIETRRRSELGIKEKYVRTLAALLRDVAFVDGKVQQLSHHLLRHIEARRSNLDKIRPSSRLFREQRGHVGPVALGVFRRVGGIDAGSMDPQRMVVTQHHVFQRGEVTDYTAQDDVIGRGMFAQGQMTVGGPRLSARTGAKIGNRLIRLIAFREVVNNHKATAMLDRRLVQAVVQLRDASIAILVMALGGRAIERVDNHEGIGAGRNPFEPIAKLE